MSSPNSKKKNANFVPRKKILCRKELCRGKTRVFSDQFSHSGVCNSLRPHELQHARPPCPSPTPGVYSNSCPLNRWCHPTVSSSVMPFSSCLQSFPALWIFSKESALYIRWPKCWSFSFNISSSNKYSGLISFRMDWFGSPCSPRDSQESSPTPLL